MKIGEEDVDDNGGHVDSPLAPCPCSCKERLLKRKWMIMMDILMAKIYLWHPVLAVVSREAGIAGVSVCSRHPGATGATLKQITKGPNIALRRTRLHKLAPDILEHSQEV